MYIEADIWSALQMRKTDEERTQEAGEKISGLPWPELEIQTRAFKDERLGKRCKTVLTQLSEATAESMPWACQDWANTKAAYRFFDNERVSEQEILAGHFQATKERFAGTKDAVLVLHDTTELSYRRENIGLLHKPKYGGDDHWRNDNPLCGILMHSSMVLTQGGLPLGLAAVKFWTRKRFKGTNALKRSVNPTRVPIEQKESMRWLENIRQSTRLLSEATRCVHIGDRESDIYELFCAANEERTHFLVRTCANRLAKTGTTTVAEEMETVKVKGLHRIEVRDKTGHISEALLELKYKRLKVLPPIGKRGKYPALNLTVVHAQERNAPRDREPIDWKLLTDLPVTTQDEAVEKLNWYALRWKIEVFHKILKSGCKVEDSGLRTAERLVRLIATCSILAWRTFWMTMINRIQPSAAPQTVLTEVEISVLDRLDGGPRTPQPMLSDYLTRIAKLGGYLDRKNDPYPGNIIMWRGLARLTDITLGFSLRSKIVGN